MLDLFSKTQIRIVSCFLRHGFAHLSCKMIWFPARIRMHNSYGNPGLPYPQSWRQTKWSWNPQWPGFGRNCTPLAGCGAHAGGAFYWAAAVQCSQQVMPLGECKPRTLGGSFHPWGQHIPILGCMTVRRCAKVLAGGVRRFLAGMLCGEAKQMSHRHMSQCLSCLHFTDGCAVVLPFRWTDLAIKHNLACFPQWCWNVRWDGMARFLRTLCDKHATGSLQIWLLIDF